VLIGAVVYLVLAPKGREDPATLSGSAAELLEPDSIEDDNGDGASDTAKPEPGETTQPPGDTEEDAGPAVDEAHAEAVADEADEADAAEHDNAAKDDSDVEKKPVDD
jgi:hypothetical protein